MSYSPHNWVTGETVTAVKLNNMEAGIADNDAAITNLQEGESDLQGAVEDLQDDVSEINTALSTKADIDQSYSDLGSGYTTTLKPTKYNKDEQPYLFRKALGARLTSEKIVGGTVAWNQLVQNGDFADTSAWLPNATFSTMQIQNNEAVMTVVAVAGNSNNNKIYQNDKNIISGHKYFVSADIYPKYGNEFDLWLGNASQKIVLASTTTANVWGTKTAVFSASGNYSSVGFGHVTNSGYVEGDTYKFRKAFIIDLTLALGTTIADHIYALEQAQAGAGVAFLRNNGFMLKDYYAYDAGSLQSVLTSGHKTVGFNAFDVVGNPFITSDANNVNTGKIPVLAGNKYTFSHKAFSSAVSGQYIRWYDSNETLISDSANYYNASYYEATAPSNACYADLKFYRGSGITASEANNANVCFHLTGDGSRNGEYEPYESHTYPLSPVSLRGIMTLVDGKLQNDGDEYYPDGTVERRYGIKTLTGTENFTLAEQGTTNPRRFILNISSWGMASSSSENAISTHFVLKREVATTDVFGTFRLTPPYLIFPDSGEKFADADELKAWLAAQYSAGTPVEIVYCLATPTTETADPYQSEQTCSEYGTEAFIDERDVPIPVGHVTDYWPDLTAKIEALPDVTAIADVENNATASKPYVVGEYFFRNGEFCKAKTAIASGATFTLNTNYETTTIAAELYAAINS